MSPVPARGVAGTGLSFAGKQTAPAFTHEQIPGSGDVSLLVNRFSRKTYHSRGFALVVTLSLLILLTVIAVGLLSLSAITLRSSAAGSAQAKAQANARLALLVAIGELQKSLGPDQRTSATANLLKDDTKNPYWVGAWNTEGGFRGWLVSGNEAVIQPATLEEDISSPPFTPDFDFTSAPPDSYVRLVGKNTLGAGAPPVDHVFAPLVSLTQNSKPFGRYAWWVGDEGVKANLASPIQALSDSSASVAERLKFLTSSPNRGFPTLGGAWTNWLPSPDGILPDADVLPSKVVSRKQVALASPALTATEEDKARFHDFTVSSAGVLSDSKNGGLRKDLSIAFEIPEASFKNSEFTRVLTAGEQPLAFATDHESIKLLEPGSTTVTSPTSPLFAYITNGSPFKGRFTKTAVNYRDDSTWPAYDPQTVQVYRGPTFDQLRDHYQLYRRLNSPFSPAASINAQVFHPNAPHTTLKGSSNNGENWVRGPWMSYFGQSWRSADTGTYRFAVTDTQEMFSTQYVRIRPITTELVPEVTRFSYGISLQSFKDPSDPPDENRLRAFFHPFVVLHNPYNVVLKSPPLNIRNTRGEMKVSINVIGPGADYSFNIENLIDNTGSSVVSDYGRQIQGDANAYQSIDYYISDSGNTLTDAASTVGDITLQPGEIRLYTIRGSDPTDLLGPDGFTNATGRRVSMQAVNPSSPGDLFSTGFFIDVKTNISGTAYKIKDGATFTATPATNLVGGGSSTNTKNAPVLGLRNDEWYLLTTKLVTPSYVTFSKNYSWPQVRQLKFYHNKWWLGQRDFPPTNPAPVFQMPLNSAPYNPSGAKTYVAKTDMYLRPAKDGSDTDRNFSLITHNPRAMVQSPSSAGAQGPGSTRGPATWSGSVETLDGSSPGFDKRFWGTSTELTAGGQTSIMLYDIPRAPLASIAGFQNANLSRLWTSPTYAVGNSYASPYVPADRVWRSSSTVPASSSGATNTRYWNLDDSYIFNEALFDSYFFSGVNPGLNGTAWNNPLTNSSVFLGSADPTSATPLKAQLDDWRNGNATPANPLLNPRLKFSIPTGRSGTAAATELDVTTAYATAQTKLDTAADIRPHNAIAAYLLAQGSFNVNSVSIDAWRSMLAGLRGAVVDHFSSPTSMSTDSGSTQTPFPRASLPGADSSTGSDEKLWNGFRSLTDAQLNTLATEIVTEIKDRARNRPASANPRPFTTLGEFINRRLVASSSPFSLKGALQAAIDRTINNTPNSLTGQTVIPADSQFKSVKYPNPSQNSADKEEVTTNYDNPAALASATIAGTPQWFSQADLLERIGPQLSARSDTFTIRSYGESVNPVSGVVEGRAWLEAVVQRETAYVNPADHPALPVSVISAENKIFGRSFRIVSFRWLTPDEI